MELEIRAKTNYPIPPMINYAIFKCTYDDAEFIVDRGRTDYSYEDGILDMTWSQCHLWNGLFEEYLYDISWDSLFECAEFQELDIEVDAPEDYIVEPLEIRAYYGGEEVLLYEREVISS